MRIGIILGSAVQSGGGYQHEMAILENLKLYASNYDHQFFVFSYDFTFDMKIFECDHLTFIKIKNSSFRYKFKKYIQRPFKYFLHKSIDQDNPLNIVINKYNIDLMYYQGPLGHCLIIDLPYILTVWDLQHRLHPEFPEVSSKGIWKNREKFYQEAIGKASAIIVDEIAGKEDVIRFYNVREEKIHVLPFIPPKLNRKNEISFENIKNKYNIKSDYIFYPAQFWPHKNHIAILNAVKILKEEFDIEISVVFIGSDRGNLTYIKKTVNDFKLKNQFFFLGFVPDADIPALYKGALALVMPTYFGPSNIPISEAFFYKCPVITSDIRGIRDQVGDAGILVNPGDFRALSDAIYKLITETTLREKLISRGEKKYQLWTGKMYIENLIKIINRFSSSRLCWENKYQLK